MKNLWKIIFLLAIVAILALIAIPHFPGSRGVRSPTPTEESQAPAPEATPTGYVDQLLEQMEFGAIAFNAPSNINIDNSTQIQLLLSLAQSVENLKQAIVEEGERIGTNISVSDRMEARLTGYMFQITAITPEIQAVSKNQETEWRWEIYPKKEGKHSLHLTLTALLEINGHSTPRSVRTFDRTIDVTVTPTQKIKIFVKSNWQWLWAAILIPVGGWLWKRKRSIKQDDKP
jgi:hypothetical protein